MFSSFVISSTSVVDARTDNNFPFDTTYTVQKLGMHDEILEDILVLPIFLENKCTHNSDHIKERYLCDCRSKRGSFQRKTLNEE